MPDSSFKFPNFQNDVDQRDEEKKNRRKNLHLAKERKSDDNG